MTESHNIGQRLREFGEKHFADRHAFADALDVSYESLTNYITGRATPGNKMQAKLRSLGCDIEWLMTGNVNAVREESGKYSLERRVAELESENADLKRRLDTILKAANPQLNPPLKYPRPLKHHK